MFVMITVDDKISHSNYSDMAAELWKFKKYYGNKYFPKWIFAIVSIVLVSL